MYVSFPLHGYDLTFKFLGQDGDWVTGKNIGEPVAAA